MRMQQSGQPAVCSQISQISARLESFFGRATFVPNSDPVAELVGTILSQHTTDAKSAKAFAALRGHFPTWSSVADADVEEVAEVIRSAGLSMQKARTIKAALVDIGGEDLGRLADLPVAEARSRLTAIRGIGDKTSCVLLFALGMPAQPVDTHIERVCKRLGIADQRSSATDIQNLLENCLESDGGTMNAFHVHMVRLGREICQARAPHCERCVLASVCTFYAHTTRLNPPNIGTPSEGAVVQCS